MKEYTVKKNQHSVYMMCYHVIFVVKRRKKVLTQEMGDFLFALGKRLIEGYGGELIEMNTDEDHLHMLISLKPSHTPSRCIGNLKTQFSKELRQHYGQEIALKLEGGALWSASYFVATTGGANIETIKNYIESQGTEEHKRKYEKTGRYTRKKRKYTKKT